MGWSATCLLAAQALLWHVGAAQATPDDAARLRQLSELAASQQRQGEYKAAEGSYRKILALRPGMPEVLSNLGLMLHLQGEYRLAIDTFAKALEARPTLFVPNLFTGSALVHLGRAKEALPYLERAVAIAPTDAQAVFHLAQAFGSTGEYQKAGNYYADATRLDPGNADAWFGLGIVYLKLGQIASERLSKLDGGASYAQALLAEALVEQGHLERAAKIYLELNNARPTPPCAQTGLGRIYLLQGKTDAAASAFASQLKLDSRCPQGPLPQSPGELTENARHLVLQRNTLKLDGLRDLARASYYSGESASTLAASERFEELHASDAEMLYLRAHASQKLAVAALGEAGRKAPNSHKLHLLLGDTYRSENRLRDALAEYHRALELKPSDLAGHWGLARTYYQSTEYDEALVELRTILNERRDDAEAGYIVGRILVSKRQLDAAVPYLKSALAGPAVQVPHAHALLARIYAERGENLAAIVELRQSLDADEDGSYHLRIYRLYKETGDEASATKALETAKSLRSKQAGPGLVPFAAAGSAQN